MRITIVSADECDEAHTADLSSVSMRQMICVLHRAHRGSAGTKSDRTKEKTGLFYGVRDLKRKKLYILGQVIFWINCF